MIYEIESKDGPNRKSLKSKFVPGFPKSKLKLINDLANNERCKYLNFKTSPSYLFYLNQMNNYLSKKDKLICFEDVLGNNIMGRDALRVSDK